MGLRIKTNVDALVAQRHLTENRRGLTDSLEKMSSGLRVNKSSDDAAGLAISERIRATTRGLDVAKRNASDGVSYIQVAEGGLNEATSIMIRMRELTSQAASDTLGVNERGFLQREFEQLQGEVARILESTEFNGTKLLVPSESSKPISIFVGASNRGQNPDGSDKEIPEVDPDVLTIDISNLGQMADAIGSVLDPDVMGLTGENAQELGGDESTGEIFRRLDTALNEVASYRATLGAVNSRINSAIANIEISSENLLAAQSRIRDVDYASETAKYTQARILSQSSIAVLSQANQQPEAVLQLLRG